MRPDLNLVRSQPGLSLVKDDLEKISDRLTDWLDPDLAQKMIDAIAPLNPQQNGLMTPQAVALKAKNAREPEQPSFMLEETFAVDMLGAATIAASGRSGKDISELVQPTGRWHHQIKTDNQPTGYAYTSVNETDGTYEVCQLFVSDIARAIDEAAVWLLKYEKTHSKYAGPNTTVRLLVVPGYNVHAFWLYRAKKGESEIVVIDAPVSLEKLERETLLSSSQFLKAFEGIPPMNGLIF